MLTLLVIANFFTAEDEGSLLAIHTYCGYLIGLLLVFRVVWGVVGSRNSRFGDFLRPWPETRAYLRQLLRLSPPRYVGHNPLGGWMILVILVTLSLIVLTGMATAVGEGARIPFISALPHWVYDASEEIHETAAHLMMVLAAVHFVGILADWLLTGDNFIKAMVTGRKTVEESVRPTPAVGAWRAVVVATLLLVAGGWMVSQTSFENMSDYEHERGESRHHDDERGDD
jgi:cytochrome b